MISTAYVVALQENLDLALATAMAELKTAEKAEEWNLCLAIEQKIADISKTVEVKKATSVYHE
jgi:hypothetical protein